MNTRCSRCGRFTKGECEFCRRCPWCGKWRWRTHHECEQTERALIAWREGE